MNPTVLAPSMTEVKERIDTRLHEYCAARIQAANQLNPHYAQLWEAIAALLGAGGKRFRPYMLLATFKAYEGTASTPDTVLPAALAQELIHQAMLIHDDIIDRDTIRYGVKNVAGQYDALYKPFLPADDERNHMSLSTAILAGDALLSDAYQLLSETAVPADRIAEATKILSDGVFEVIGGELLDTQTSFLNDPSLTAETIARLKTASYSFISPITMGAILAGAPQAEIAVLRQLAEQLGIGYQLKDDLLGIFGDETQTGKSTSTDITEGKRTYMIEQFELLANDEQRQAFIEVFHKPDATDRQLVQARNLLIESGAKKSVETAIDLMQAKAEQLLTLLSISNESKEVFRDLIRHCMSREK